MAVMARNQPSSKKQAAASAGHAPQTRAPDSSKALRQGQGPGPGQGQGSGANLTHRPDVRKPATPTTKTKPMPIATSKSPTPRHNWKGGRNSRMPVGAIAAAAAAAASSGLPTKKKKATVPVDFRVSKPVPGHAFLEDSISPESGSGSATPSPTLTPRAGAFETALTTADVTPSRPRKTNTVQVSVLSRQLEALALKTDSETATADADPKETLVIDTVMTGGTSAPAEPANPDNDASDLAGSYHQGVLGSTYEVKIDGDFISSTAQTETPSIPDDPFGYPSGAHRKMTAQDFEPLKYLGKGGFGTVVLVKQKTTGRLYALKQLRKESLLVYKRGAESARTERNVLESINRHSFMVTLYYAFQDETKLYLLLQYAQGGELFQHLREERMLPESTVSFYMAEMVLALEFLHKEVGVVYRDLKPENCLLDADGHLLLTDFGLCKEGMNDGGRCRTFTGTVAYMAPEVIKGDDYGFPVDWWSLGAIGVDLLTGSPPFRGANDKAVSDKIVKAKLGLPVYLSPDAKDLFIRLLRKDPSHRLGTNMPGDMVKIKSHRFFRRRLDWDKLAKRELEPPIKPFIIDPALAENFASEFTSIPVTPSDEHFRSNIDDIVYRSRNPSPNKGKNKRSKKDGGRSGVNTPKLASLKQRRTGNDRDGCDGCPNGDAGSDDPTGDGSDDYKSSDDTNDDDDDDDSRYDPAGVFGGFSFTASPSVFQEGNFWVS